MNNSFGEIFRITTFGESHGAAIGVVIDGVPAGLEVDASAIQRDLDRRRPGQSAVSTPRAESDLVEILSGVFEGITTGTPIAMLIRNTNQHSSDYDRIKSFMRPGHADAGYMAKYGRRDYRGGGRSSGRETAARVAAGALAKLLLKKFGIEVQAYTTQVGQVQAERYAPECAEANIVRSVDPDKAAAMIQEIERAKAEGDSVGGVVECRATGVCAGLGEPVFDKLDALLAQAALSIGGVKAVEFGAGFKVAGMRGSENNDQRNEDGYLSNNSGGISGGISTGEEIIFRVAVKPTPSISKPQSSVDAAGAPMEAAISGRHDPCLCPRLTVVLEAMTALVLADALLRSRLAKI